MEVNFDDFTKKKLVHDYLINNSKKSVIKIESRQIDEDGVVLTHSDQYLEDFGDIKYYFEDTESLEINRLNSMAIFIRANGEKLLIDSSSKLDFEKSFIDLINSELGLDFKLKSRPINITIEGSLSENDYITFNDELKNVLNKFSLKIK